MWTTFLLHLYENGRFSEYVDSSTLPIINIVARQMDEALYWLWKPEMDDKQSLVATLG